MTKFKAKTFDGKEVEGTYLDLGLVDGIWKSKFSVGDKEVVSEVDAELMKVNGNTAEFRLLEECAFLETLGIDGTTLEMGE